MAAGSRCRANCGQDPASIRERIKAGEQSGAGDWRQQKGSGSYGSYILVAADNPDFKRVMAEGGRKAQVEALQNPVAYNDETSEMLAWFGVEFNRRGFKAVA